MKTLSYIPVIALVLSSAAFSSFAANLPPASTAIDHAAMMGGNANNHNAMGMNNCMPVSTKISMSSNAAEHIRAAMIHENSNNGHSPQHQQMAAEHMAQAYQ